MAAIIRIDPDHEVECDRAKLYKGCVLIRCNGVWIRLVAPATGPEPRVDEHRLIDGIDHVWCGRGWIAMNYSEFVKWPVELPKDDDRPVAVRMDER